MAGFYNGIVAVIEKARSDRPYVVAVPTRRFYRMVSPTEMEGLPYWEAHVVEDLASEGELVPGRQVELICREANGEFKRVVKVLDLNTRKPDIQFQRPLGGWA